MQVFSTGAEYKLKEMLEGIREQSYGWRAQHFRISTFKGELSVKESSKVSYNIIGNQLRDEHGAIFFCEDGDIVILCKAVQKKVLDDIAYQLSFLFAENLEQTQDLEFQHLYDVAVFWAEVFSLCQEKIKSARALEKKQTAPKEAPKDEISQAAQLQRDAERLSLARRRPRAKLNVLLVEDDPLSLRLARNTLGGDYTVITASTGAEAYNAYLLNAPDVVFLDIGLPDTTGHQVLEKILKLDPNAYIQMLSGNSYREEIMKAIQLGAKGFISKPFTREKLLHGIVKCPQLVAG